MAHDAFISYSGKDKTTADGVCAVLENEGIRCWIAPRDVVPGMEWSECIIEAIEQSKVMVLVFTADANASPQIRREVERAVNHGVAILPLRVEDVMPGRALEYFIGNVHWLDALTPPLETHLKNLAGTIKMLLARGGGQPAGPAPHTPAGDIHTPAAHGPVYSMPQTPSPLRESVVTGTAAAPAAHAGEPAGTGATTSSGGPWGPGGVPIGGHAQGPAVAPPPRKGVPPWVWFAGGGVLLVLILIVVVSVALINKYLPSNSATSNQASTASTSSGDTGSGSSDATASIPAGMQPYTSDAGRFSVLFPGTPAQKTQQIALEGGASSTLFQTWVGLEDDNVAYMVFYNDYPPGYATGAPQAVLEAVRDGVVKGKTLLTDEPIDLNGVPGRAFTATDTDGLNYTVHEFLVGKRLYQLMVASSKDHPATMTDAFLNSFKIN